MWRAGGGSLRITRLMLRIWTCSETRSPVFRPHDASALDSIDVLGLQHTLLIQRAFGRNGNPLIENRASLGVDGGRRVHLHDFPVAGFQRKLRAVHLVNDAAKWLRCGTFWMPADTPFTSSSTSSRLEYTQTGISTPSLPCQFQCGKRCSEGSGRHQAL